MQIKRPILGAAMAAFSILLSGCGSDGVDTATTPSVSESKATIRPLVAAGGYSLGIVYHPSVQGLAYARTDVGGAYRRDPGSSTWVPLNDDLNRDNAQFMGVESLAVDTNNSQKLYLATGMYLPSWGRTAALLRSSDRGATRQRTELPFRLGGNSDGRGTGDRLQLDPHLGRILFLGTNQDGLYKSTDSGVTWNKVTPFSPTATTFVLFERSNGFPGVISSQWSMSNSARINAPNT